MRVYLSMHITLREAVLDDAGIMHCWRNDDRVRKQSFNQEKIPYQHHQRWLENALGDLNKMILIILYDGKPAGSVRYELESPNATVSVQVAPDFHGRGIGSEALKRATEILKNKHPGIQKIIANIKLGNTASEKAFSKAGFQLSHSVYEYSLR